MGQPPPPNGPQGPYPGQQPQGPPHGYGQQPPQGPPGQFPPQGMPPQGPPPGYGHGYGQQPPQGPPPGFGQQPPQGPPGQFPPPGMPPQGPPPGYGPPGAPRKRTGLIVGGAIGAVVLVAAIGGVVIALNSSSVYTAMPNDCAEAFDNGVLSPFFDGDVPSASGGFDPEDRSIGESFGTLSCSIESDGVYVEVAAELIDPDDPETQRDLDELFSGDMVNEELGESFPPGEITEREDYGVTSQVLWDFASIGTESLVMASVVEGGGDMLSASGSMGVGAFLTDNIAGTVAVAGAGGDREVQDLFNTVESVSGDVSRQLTRSAEK
ncbi:hypothetical protein [Nocardiopsis sp. NPDC058789]